MTIIESAVAHATDEPAAAGAGPREALAASLARLDESLGAAIAQFDRSLQPGGAIPGGR